MEKEVFDGVKVLDFGWAVAVPWTMKYLADHGATVVHVESTQHPDFLRTGPPFKDGKPGIDSSYYFSIYHSNKYGMCLNMRHPRARLVIQKLVDWADILVENFAPGVMDKWGLSYEEVNKIHPDIIMLSSSQLGQLGPFSSMPGSGIQLAAYAGLNSLTGWPDREPCVLYGGFTDCPAGRLGGALLIAALLYRRRTGNGVYIDLSQYESAVHLIAPVIMDYQVNGRIAERQGNHHPFAVPHGIYQCSGEDSWCAITVSEEWEWRGLCKAMGEPEWTKEKRLSTMVGRKDNEAFIDERISGWTVSLSADEIMLRLQEHGVPAGVVQKSSDLYSDPQLQEYDFFNEVEHPVIGVHKIETHAFKLSKTPRKIRMPAPCIGQHTEFVCREILKLSDDEFVDLMVDGVFE